ncbi:MAG: hypothetical protein OXI81_18415 [Paracoccaceae bacterium]|nr:hypothetical protein [Paracoccaceae bacterium]
MPTLLLAVFLGALVFAATLFSAAQLVRVWHRKWLRLAHLVSLGATLAAMAALQLDLVMPSRAAGLPLLVSAAGAFTLESGWNRILPLIQVGLAGFLLFLLPTWQTAGFI